MFLHRLVLTAALAASLAVGAPGAHGAAAVAIDGIDVEQVAALGSGTPLRFAVYGTPHASVTLRIEGGWHLLALRESDPGIYEGTYVVDARDAVVASSRVTATLQHDGQLATAALDEPLLRAATPLPWADAARAQGQVAATASPPPVPAVVAPPVTAPHAEPVPVVVAAVSTPPARTAAAPAVVVAHAPQRASCDDCAFVQLVRLVEPTTPGGAIGAVAGAIAGAVLGKELGEEHHRRILALLGALGGAFAGHEVGKRATQQRAQYDVVLRTRDGRAHTLRFDHAPSFGPGDTVRFGAVRNEALPGPL